MSDQYNPCANCPTNCCEVGLLGLMLSKDEYEKNFKAHKQNFLVTYSNKAVILFAKEGVVCPYFAEGGCSIYNERPIDCQLHPYMAQFQYELRSKVKFLLRTSTSCPRKEKLLLPIDEARTLVTAFGEKVYGGKKIIVQDGDNIISRIGNRAETIVVKLLQGVGILH